MNELYQRSAVVLLEEAAAAFEQNLAPLISHHDERDHRCPSCGVEPQRDLDGGSEHYWKHKPECWLRRVREFLVAIANEEPASTDAT